MADLTLATVDYNVVSFIGRQKILRASTATAQENLQDNLLERAFTPATSNRPARALMKFSGRGEDNNGILRPVSLHLVTTVDPNLAIGGYEAWFNSTTNGFFKQLLELVSLGTDYLYINDITTGAI